MQWTLVVLLPGPLDPLLVLCTPLAPLMWVYCPGLRLGESMRG